MLAASVLSVPVAAHANLQAPPTPSVPLRNRLSDFDAERRVEQRRGASAEGASDLSRLLQRTFGEGLEGGAEISSPSAGGGGARGASAP